jgi:hypothetical protein
MPSDRRVRGLEVSWEDSVVVDELFEEWQSRRDVAWIDGSNSDDSGGSVPPLFDGSDLDEQDLGDRQLGLDAAGLIHYPEDTVVYGGIPFGSVLSPLELLRQREEYETHLNREAVGLCQVIHPRVASVIYGSNPWDFVRTFLACAPLLGIEYFRGSSMPQLRVVLVGT